MVFVESYEIQRRFGRWAAECNSPSRDRFTRMVLLMLLLGKDGSARRSLARVRSMIRRAPPSIRNIPVSPKLAAFVEEQVELRYLPQRVTVDGARRFTLPRWLALKAPRRRGFPRSVRVDLISPEIKVEDALTLKRLADDRKGLGRVILRRQRPSHRRRMRMIAAAATLLDLLERVLGTPPAASGRLRRMVDDPVAAESEAIRVWNAFVEDCDVPAAFRVTGRTLSLGDLLVLRRGADAGRHRQTYASQQPWSAKLLLREDDPDEAFEPIDDNPANGIDVAARYLCCDPGNGAPCDKAVRFARSMPRHRGNSAVDRLLGGQDRASRRLRSLVMEASEQDGRELLFHVGTNVKRTRQQVARALEVLHVYEGDLRGSFDCAYALAALLIRTLVRDGLEPEDLEPRTLASGLVAMAADCLAPFVAERLMDPSVQAPPDSEDDSIDIGVQAFVKTLGNTRRPQMTARQLVRFTAAASQRAVHRILNVHRHVDRRWPVPPGWSASAHSSLAGVGILPLTSIGDLKAEGRRMKNCLAEGLFDRRAALGRLALFSLRSGADRATLALEPEETLWGRTLRVAEWRIDQLRGKANDEPSRACTLAAATLVARLNETCPFTVPEVEVRRRGRVRAMLDQSRTFNADVVLAQERWTRIYSGLLPRRLASLSPSEMVDEYLGVRPENQRTAQDRDP